MIRRYVVSSLGLHCLPMSYKMDAKLWVSKGAAARFADWSVPCLFHIIKLGPVARKPVFVISGQAIPNRPAKVYRDYLEN